MKTGKFAAMVAWFVWLGVASAQPPVAFEVASIRIGAPFSMELLRSGGVGLTVDGNRVNVRSLSLSELIAAAYEIRTDQVTGPAWLTSERFDIQALIPMGLTRSDIPRLLRELLASRFQMNASEADKEFPVYALTVKQSGHRLRTSAIEAATASGCTVDGKGMRTCRRMTMEKLANQLTQLYRMYVAMPPGGMPWGLELPVVDATALPGEFDFDFPYGPAPEEAGGGSVVDSVDKLGLRLTRQTRIERLIRINSITKTPSEN